MQVSFSGERFECVCSFNDRQLPKNAGFKWDAIEKVWYTSHCGVAALLLDYLDDSARDVIARRSLSVIPWQGPLLTPDDRDLKDFQVEAARFALARNKSYLALDPGLGKTPIAAVIAETLHDRTPIFGIYICPPFLTRNVEHEFSIWAPSVNVCQIKVASLTKGFLNEDLTIVPDSIINRKFLQDTIFQMIMRAKKLGKRTVLFIDEAHRFKNDDAGRTRALFGYLGYSGIAEHFDKVVYLSGTPMPNRPIELYPVLNHSAPHTIDHMTKHQFATKYCGAFQNHYGWDYTGATNIDELARKVIGPFMLRFKKKDVLKDLPPKIEEMVLLDDQLPPKQMKLSAEILRTYSPEDLMKSQISLALGKTDLHIATYRKTLGLLKAHACSTYIDYILEETEDNVLVFAIHKETIALMDKNLGRWSPLTVTGDTRMELRDAMVKKFQTDIKQRLFIGNIQAAGVGFTLTKATRVVFAEFSWVPADNDQAADRAHRIGQNSAVLVEYLVQKHSIDKAVIETMLRKKRITAKI